MSPLAARRADPDDAAAPIGEAPITELLEAMEAALLTLPRFTREVFLAHRLDDVSYADMARITGTSVRRIEREIARAIAGIDRALCDNFTRARWWKGR